MYCKIENNKAGIPQNLPKTHETIDGWITGFNHLSDTDLKHYGWLPVEKADLSGNQRHGTPVIEKDRVYFPAEDFTVKEIQEKNQSAAKVTRDDAETATINVHGENWQVREDDRTRMKETIDTAIRQEYPPKTTINWIMADNTVRSSTRADFEAVLDSFSLRRQEIFTQYEAWRSGDKMQPFSCSV